MKAVRELRIRFKPGPLRPRVFWRRSVRDAGQASRGDGESPSLQIELKNGSVFITSVDDCRSREEVGGSGTWEELFETRAAWTGGARVAVDFTDEFPDGSRTLIGLGLTEDAEGAPERRAEARADVAPMSRRGESFDGARTRFFDIEQRAVDASWDQMIEASKSQEVAEARGGDRAIVPTQHATQIIRRPLTTTVEALLGGYARRVGRVIRSARLTAPRVFLITLLAVALLALFAVRLRFSGRASGSAAAAMRPAPTASVASKVALATQAPAQPLGAKQAPDAILSASDVEAASALPASAGEKTLERRAADAVATGAFSDAVPLYDELARLYPTSRVYREAARILRSQRSAGRSAQADAR